MSLPRAIVAGLRRAGLDYRCFRVMRLALDRCVTAGGPGPGLVFAATQVEDVAASRDEAIASCDWYGGEDADGFVLRRDGRIVCLQWIWHGERARRHAFWPLGPRDAVSMHLVTVPDERGHGHATLLKQLSAAVLRDRGFEAIYSRIWWTNTPSLRVSEKAGWMHAGTTLSLELPGRSRPVEWRWRRRTPVPR